MISLENKIVEVPEKFREPDRFHYPSDNWPDWEYWLFLHLKEEEIKGNRHYLPVFYTSYFKKHGYGKNQTAIQDLQNFVNLLDRDKKYFTTVQYDDGCLIDWKDLDIKVFSMAGGRKDYGLPLIAQEHKFNYEDSFGDIFCSFIGRDTHPIRNTIFKTFKNGLYYHNDKKYFISSNQFELKDYCYFLAKSTFTLCPRGYSANSFRIQEAIQFLSIPVYISDVFLPMHDLDFKDFGVIVDQKDISHIYEILDSIPKEEIARKKALLKDIYDNYFTFEANKRIILKVLQDELD